MSRPKGGTNVSHSKEEKLALVLRNLSGETARALEKETEICHTQIHKWAKQYLEDGEEAVYYFNYVRPIRIKCKRKSPVQVRLEQAA